MASFTLQKHERLKSKKLIEELFNSGKSSFSYPIKLMYLELSDLDSPLKMSVTVPKRHFKKAVDRNHMKRKVREAYRLHKSDLEQRLIASGRQMVCMLILVSKEKEEYCVIESAIKKLLKRL